MKKYLLLLLAVGFCFTRAPAAQATVTFNYDYTFSGTSPAGTAPWLTATFENSVINPGGINSVLATLSAAGLSGTEFVSNWYFNVDPYVNGLTITQTGGTPPGSIPLLLQAPTGLNAHKADGDGYYDVQLIFPTANGADLFAADETMTILFSGAGLTENSFFALSAPGGGSGPFLSAAHVQGIGKSGGWVAPSSPVPEPSTFLLLASGLVSLPFLRRRFRQ